MFRLVVFIALRESLILTNLTGKRQDFARITIRLSLLTQPLCPKKGVIDLNSDIHSVAHITVLCWPSDKNYSTEFLGQIFQLPPKIITVGWCWWRRWRGWWRIDCNDWTDMPEGATRDWHSANHTTVVVTGIDHDGLLKSIVFLVYGAADAINACCNFVPTIK